MLTKNAAAGLLANDKGTGLAHFSVLTSPANGTLTVNADGSFKSITQVAQQLKDKLGPLTQAQRLMALTTIFGSDATRAASVLMDEGAKGLGKYIKATNDQSAAQREAAGLCA